MKFGKPSTNLEEKLKSLSPKYFWLVAFCSTLLLYTYIFSVSGMLPNGKHTVLRLDMNHQYIPYFEYLMDVIRGKHDYWFSWSNFLGLNNAGMFGYFCMSPLNLLLLLFDQEHAVTGITIIIILKSAFSSAFMQLFLAYFLRLRRFSTVIFAVFYSLCGYQILYYCAMNLTDALYALPLVMLSVVILFREGKILPLILSYALLFFTCFYMGYMIGIGSFYITAVYYFFTFSKREKKDNQRIVIKYIVSVVIAFFSTSVIWLPAVCQIVQYGEKDYSNPYYGTVNPILIINNLLIGEYQSYDGYTPYVYCGLLTFVLAFSYFFNKRIRKKEKVLSLTIIAGFIAAMSIRPLDRFMHAFDTPQMLGYRYAFILSFVLCVIACRQSVYYRQVVLKDFIFFAAMAVSVFVFSYFYYKDGLFQYKCNRIDVALINVIFFAIWIMVWQFGRSRKFDQLTFRVIVFVLVFIEITLGSSMNLLSSKKQNAKGETYKYFLQARENTLEKIDFPEENEFYRMQLMCDTATNSGLEGDYYSIASYNNFCQGNIIESFHKLGVSGAFHIIGGRGLTPFMRMLMCVKYYANCDVEKINDFYWYVQDENNLTAQYFHENEGSGSSIVEENDKYLALGFLASNDIKSVELGKSPFENQDIVASNLCGTDIDMFQERDYVCNTNDGLLIPYEQGLLESLDKSVMNDDMSEGWIFVSKNNNEKVPGTDEYKIIESSKTDEEGNEGNADSKNETEFNFIIKDNGKPVYGFFNRTTEYKSDSYISAVDESGIKEYYAPMHLLSESYINLVGHNEDGDYEEDVVMRGKDPFDYCEGIRFADYDEKELKKAYDILSQNQFEITYLHDGNVSGNIDAKEGGVMFTSIPYDIGWRVYVDGNLVETFPLIEGSFLGIDLAPGSHSIEMKYTAPGVYAGTVLSVIGVLSLMGVAIYERRYRR